MRYALRSFEDPGYQATQNQPGKPLAGEDLATLLRYITDAVGREHQSKSNDRANWTAIIAACVAAGAVIVTAAIAAYVALLTG